MSTNQETANKKKKEVLFPKKRKKGIKAKLNVSIQIQSFVCKYIICITYNKLLFLTIRLGYM